MCCLSVLLEHIAGPCHLSLALVSIFVIKQLLLSLIIYVLAFLIEAAENNTYQGQKNSKTFHCFQMTLVGDFAWSSLIEVNRLMAQVLVGSYFALTSVVCLNLYIALLSDTFSRVYAQAQANAVMQQAQLVLLVEKSLPKKKKIKFGHYMKHECGPLVRFPPRLLHEFQLHIPASNSSIFHRNNFFLLFF